MVRFPSASAYCICQILPIGVFCGVNVLTNLFLGYAVGSVFSNEFLSYVDCIILSSNAKSW
jgi:hypothetical protein